MPINLLGNLMRFDTLKAILASKNKGKLFKFIFTNEVTHLQEKPLFEEFPSKENSFGPHYAQYILPYVRSFEQERLKCLQDVRKRSIIAIPLCIISAVGFLFFINAVDSTSVDNAFGITAAIIVMLLWWSSMPVVTYKSSVKAQIFPNIFRFFGPNFQYLEQSPLSVMSMRGSQIIPNYDSEVTENYVSGKYLDVGIELVEGRLYQERRTNDRHRTTVEIFHGMLILLDVHKKFSGQTIIKKDGGMIGNFFQKNYTSLDRVKLEDPIFESKFEVYSSDQVESRYLLTTSFMERLVELSNLFGLSSIECSFYNSKLLISVPLNYDLFENSSIFEPATFEQDIKTILSEMQVIFKIIETLKLNQKIGL